MELIFVWLKLDVVDSVHMFSDWNDLWV